MELVYFALMKEQFTRALGFVVEAVAVAELGHVGIDQPHLLAAHLGIGLGNRSLTEAERFHLGPGQGDAGLIGGLNGHNAARWLESVGGSNGFYKSLRHLDFAMTRSEAMTATYVDTHRRYFRYQFAQTVAFLLIYAFASAGLLLLGGMLILRGQLSLGQLVAAELILSGVFYGISQLGMYLDTFYDLVASSEELSLLFAIPQEPKVRGANGPHDGSVKLTDVVLNDAHYNLTLEAGEQLVTVAEPGAERRLAMLLKRHALPERGLVRIGGADLGSFDMYHLRSDVTVLDRSTIVEVTIREYLRLASGDLAPPPRRPRVRPRRRPVHRAEPEKGPPIGQHLADHAGGRGEPGPQPAPGPPAAAVRRCASWNNAAAPRTARRRSPPPPRRPPRYWS